MEKMNTQNVIENAHFQNRPSDACHKMGEGVVIHSKHLI